uniref:Nudix hydrolase domain-containing protein n=1 Tax=Noctiluca scintillans TaxID=2966 RepID=A0A7S1F357_NOCSC
MANHRCAMPLCLTERALGQRCFSVVEAKTSPSTRVLRAQAKPRQVLAAGPSPNISVHKGFKIQAALCVERPPLEVLEPDHKKRWNKFRDAWERRTKNAATIQDEIVFMRYHFQFLEAETKSRRALTSQSSESAVAVSGGDLDSLISGEGLNLTFPERRRVVHRKKVAKKVEVKLDDTDLRSAQRLSRQSLYLLARYPGAAHWTFPKVDRVHGDSMMETVMKLCGRQLGDKFAPYVLGSCPFAHWKRRDGKSPGIQGRKIFYYRARLVPGMQVVLPGESPLEDWAWLSREELRERLGRLEWDKIRDCLPLDHMV